VTLKQKRYFWIFVWLLILAAGPITVLKKTPIANLTFQNVPLLINFFQRITALLAFSMLFIQIILGSFMTGWTQKLGGKVFNFHLTQGAVTYALVLAHPILFVLYNFKIKGIFDPFYVFTEVCLYCRNLTEFWYTLGRVSFWLISMAVLAAILRNEPWWRKNWRKFHILNYFAFFLIAIQAWFVGTDTKTPPFAWVYWLAVFAVAFSIFFKLLYPYVAKYLSTKDHS